MDNNLLKQLIAQHRRVVIPDFGAFLKKDTPQGEELVFSPFLRKDDGTVTDAIVREYGVETEELNAQPKGYERTQFGEDGDDDASPRTSQ